MASNKKNRLDSIISSYLNDVLDVNELVEKAIGMSTSDNTKKETSNSTKEKKVSNAQEKVSEPTPTIPRQPIVVVDHFTKLYSGRTVPAVNNISFNIYPGDFHAFIGANGAGKTTTIKAIIGAYSKSKYHGSITIAGNDNQTVNAKRLIGYIPENANFPKKMNTRNYLISMAMLAGYTSSEAKIKATKIINSLGMSAFEKKRPITFSSGQKKKILLAQALLSDPEVLIMDEPAANLDPLAREDLFETLLSLQKKGKAIFISSHILDEVDRYATCATILDGGRVVFDGKLDGKLNLTELYKKYVKLGSVDNNR